jgi:hypothetical protein
MKFKEQDNYAIAAWINDLLNIIKVKSFLQKKEDAFLVFMENSAEFLTHYSVGDSPRESYDQFVMEDNV